MIRNREHLLEWLETAAPYRFIRRAMFETGVEFLGGFREVPPYSTDPGGIIRGRAKFGTEWILAVVPNRTDPRKRKMFILSTVPWLFWCGGTHENKLYQGDHPEIYKGLRDAEAKK